jgi:hypothetical protein
LKKHLFSQCKKNRIPYTLYENASRPVLISLSSVYHEKSPQITQIYTNYKKISVISVICGPLFFIVSGRRRTVMNVYHEKSPQITQIYTNYKKISVISVICGPLLFVP